VQNCIALQRTQVPKLYGVSLAGALCSAPLCEIEIVMVSKVLKNNLALALAPLAVEHSQYTWCKCYDTILQFICRIHNIYLYHHMSKRLQKCRQFSFQPRVALTHINMLNAYIEDDINRLSATAGLKAEDAKQK
jgi:hypothetical protein